MTRSAERFHTLDAMRGIAALAVVFYHAGRMVPRGYLAVDLFFALSGFVLFHAYAHRMQAGPFLIERLIRLGPMMVIGAAIGLAINGGSAGTLLMIPTGRTFLYPANIPLWSLLFEFIAGAAFALLLGFGKRAWVAALLIGLVGVVAGIEVRGSADLGFRWDTFGYGLARTAFSFCIGIAIYRIVTRSRLRLGWPCGMLALLLPFTVMMMPQDGNVLVDYAALMVVMPLALWLGAVSRFPRAKVAAWLGIPSYALYAVHHPLVKMELSAWLTIPAAVLLAIVLGFLVEPRCRAALQPLQQRFANAHFRASLKGL
ncbi:acyltransferase family protein [Aurantiacibacter sp. MUD61]|uniref:acyltransferase family protein n=1 Tax=Aurantiacibacter sp. MUD61 TaxID=3009083 RepID=UPI0022F03131|nr:acyltransferase [Aurantiacibacter sp. MUD61]